MKPQFISILVLLFLSSGALAQEQAGYETSSLVGHSLRMMKTAGFWISRHPSPDAVIMDPQAVARFNARLRNDKKLTKDIFTIVWDLKTRSLLRDFHKTLSDFTQKGFYTAEGRRNDQDFIDAARRNMDLSALSKGIIPRYGLVVHYAYQRFLPTKKGLYQQKDDLNFDQLQNSALDPGTAVVVVHTSADGRWYYALTAISDGWVEAKNIALGDIHQVRKFAENEDFVVVIKPKADIFRNKEMSDYYDYVRMGMRLPLSSLNASCATVIVPVRDSGGKLALKEAYMNKEDVHLGFLPYTARTIYKQALMMLNQPYGWGDMYGEQDCSRFLQMVFATAGITLPRDSKDQAQVSNVQSGFDEKSDVNIKIADILKAPAACTLLPMKGHIMLYLGAVNGKPYAIHDTTVLKFDRVIISDLSLGEGTQKGSLLKRLSRTVIVE